MPAYPIDVPFRLSNPWEFPLHGVPLRSSIPLPQGEVCDPARELALVDEKGDDVGAQWRVLSTWRDGSVRFALMDYAETELEPHAGRAYRLVRRPGGQAPAKPQAANRGIRGIRGISVSEDVERLTVDTGRLRWVFSKRRFSLAEEIHAAGCEWVGGQECDAFTTDTQGQIYRASEGEYRISLEEKGPHRVVVLIGGDFRNALGKFMDYKVRLHFVAGGAQVLMSHTIRNRHAGREGRDVRRWGVAGALNLSPAKTIRRVQQTNRTLNTITAIVEVPENMDLDTGNYTTIIRNPASLRKDPNDVVGVNKSRADMSLPGACTPLIDLVEPGVGGMLFKFAMPEPDREGPMRLASDRNRFEIDFYPDGSGGGVIIEPGGAPGPAKDPMHLGEGMGKTRDVLLNFHDESLSARDRVYESNNLSYPGVVGVPRQMYRDMKFAAVHHTLPQQLNKYPLLESKIDMLLSAPQAYDWPRATGWRDWGDEIGARGRCPELGVHQFINNEEDYLYCLMIDAWRVGVPHKGRTQARHLMDIDFIDYSPDPSRDGAVCPHSTGHTNGEVYPSHQWCQGLLYYYLATGDEEALRIARRIGDNLCWWAHGPRRDALHYSGRETAWPLLGLAALYEVTHEEKYKDAGYAILNDLRERVKKHGKMAWEHPPGSGIYGGYMALMTFNGIWDMYMATGDESIFQMWKDASGPVVEELDKPDSWGYLHFRNWPIKWADLTTLMRWYHLTGDERYLRLGRNGLRLVLAGCPQPLNQTQGFIAMGYRHFIFFLKLADEKGMINDDICTLVW